MILNTWRITEIGQREFVWAEKKAEYFTEKLIRWDLGHPLQTVIFIFKIIGDQETHSIFGVYDLKLEIFDTGYKKIDWR